MPAKEKLEEAEFFLECFRHADLSKRDLFFYMDAFLFSIREVPKELLEEYAEAFHLDVPSGQIIDEKTFEREAENGNNVVALRFIRWYSKSLSAIKESFGFFLDKKTIHLRVGESQTIEMLKFDEIPDRSAAQVCQECLSMVEKFVAEAKQFF